jgi:DNA repair exonuclease SbcCD ATPase subunit
MNAINFTGIEIEGFGSIQEPFSFNFYHPGINVIRGLNGVGKTTLFNGLVWCLYGVNLKGVTKDKISTWPHVRTKEYKGTRVIVSYIRGDKRIAVARHSGFKGKTEGHTGGDSLMVFENDVLVSTGINDSNKYIEDSLGLNAKMFLNSVLFGQRMKKLIESDDADKRKVFEELFNAEWVAAARERATKKVKEYQDEVTKLTLDVNSLTYKHKAQQDILVDLTQQWDKFEQGKQDRIIELRGLVEQLNVTIGELDADILLQEEKYSPAILAELEDSQADLEGLIALSDEGIELIRTNISTHSLSKDKVQQEGNNLATRLGEYEEEKEGFLENKNLELGSKREEYTKVKNSLDEHTNIIKGVQEELSELKEIGISSELNTELATLSKDSRILELELSKYEDDVNHELKRVDSIEKEIALCEKSIQENVCALCKQSVSNNSDTQSLVDKHKKNLTETLKEINGITILIQSLQSSKVSVKERREEIIALLPQLERLNWLEIEVNRINSYTPSLENRLIVLEEQIKNIKDSEWTKTPPCTVDDINRRADEYDRLQGIVAKLQDELAELLSRKAKQQEQLAEVKNSIKTASVNKALMDTLKARRDRTSGDLQRANSELNTVSVSTFPLGKKMTEVNYLIDSLDGQIVTQQIKLGNMTDLLEQYKYWVDAFGANGVKAFIFEAMLTMLNAAMEVYAQQLGVRVRFIMDLDSSRKGIITQCYKDGGVVLYDELSGGEKQRVDIVQVFGVHDVISANVGFNILLMDEIFENLDDEGVDAVFELVRMKMVEDRSIYIITHQKEISTMYANVINFTKEGATLSIN